jgi:enamine deaminase RidA (YjgF/YER057c/UK114 family)
MLPIHRWPGTGAGRSRAVAYGGLVYTVAVARRPSESMREQTADALAVIEESLALAGTSKSRLLGATVFVADMARKAEMNAAWLTWIDPANPPQRACIGATLEGWHLVEIVAVAAVS